MTPLRMCEGCGRHRLTVTICGHQTTYRPTAYVLGRRGWWHAPCLIREGR